MEKSKLGLFGWYAITMATICENSQVYSFTNAEANNLPMS